MVPTAVCVLTALRAAALTTPPPRTIARTRLAATPRYTADSFPSDLAATDRVQQAYASPSESAGLLPPELVQFGTGALLAYAIYLGPDWILAPLGWETNIRPGRAATDALGQVIAPDSEFARERQAGFDAAAPVPVLGAAALLFLCLGFGAEAALCDALGSSTTFVGAWATCACIAGSVYEVGRPASLTRAEALEEQTLDDAFADFAERRFELAPTAATNVIEVTRAFRRSARGKASKYRSAEASVADVQIERLAKRWLRERGGVVTSSGFLKGVRLADEPDVFR
jgi:hypothetical protein